MKFLHCADLHLGCPGGGERMRAFTHMLAFCKSEKVEILLLAGDLFEAARADERTRRQVFSALAENPSLCVLIAAGNHDPIGPGGNYDGPLPENVYGLAAYEYNIESLDTVAQALTGAFTPVGRLPVPLEGGQP